MTLRERLADWLTGGALTEARAEHPMNVAAMYDLRVRIAAERRRADGNMSELILSQQRYMATRDILRRIAACETPGANATVRRMAKMAREAVE